MISPHTRTKPGTPKAFRLLLIVFVVRHIVGVGIFAWLTQVAWQVGGPFKYVMLALSLIYAGYAVFNGRKIYAQYRRSGGK